MQIKDIGGEFGLIERIAQIASVRNDNLVVGIGDDAAVLRMEPEPAPYLLVTTDLLVEERHFRRQWSTPEQIGWKAVACNASDIAAMGGNPTWMFVSLVLAPDVDVEWVESLYRGMRDATDNYRISLAGGDTAQGPVTMINITLLGRVEKRHLCLRSSARSGDLILVTGPLGASGAALALLEKGKQPSAYLMEKHLAPTCRLDISGHIAPLAHAMIDISDGLASEIRHICRQSRVGAEILTEKIPLHEEVLNAGRLLGIDPLEFALSGGEDYELLFTLAPDRLDRLHALNLNCHVIGRICGSNQEPVLIDMAGRHHPLAGGYNHFG